VPSNSGSQQQQQQLRERKRTTGRGAGVSAVPPYHPDYEPTEECEDGDGVYYHHHRHHDNDDDDDDGGEHFAEYERETPRVRRGSEGYEVRWIDREQLLAEFIASRGQEEGHYRRYAPEPSSGSSDNGRGGGEALVREDEEEEPLAVRLAKWRSGEAIA
jgi:palmitoyltransferase ZDHHC6